MGCCGGDREKGIVIKNDVKWDYVNLNDFKVQSCFTPLAYGYLWLMLIVSISVYAVDTFTAINLLAFNKWAGQIQPAIPLKYSRWIFAGCIILSFLLLIYRWARALKVMRGGKVAKSYLDPLAVRVECIRMGNGRGWKRFLVFAELTKSRKGADYVALFAYYSFEAWLRIIFAEGPRVVINGITLYSFAMANFIPVGDHAASSGQSPFVQFWANVGYLVENNKLQAAVVFGMLWTCLIWILSAISLGSSVILYLLFLWHHIPSDAKGLTGYCRTKINRRMERIVKSKTDKALKKENAIRARQEAQAYRDGTTFKRQPTLPDIGEPGTPTTILPLSRTTTMTTLPEYDSRPGTGYPSEDTLPPMPIMRDNSRPLAPKRHATNASDTSWASFHSDAPLMNGAGDMGYNTPYDRIHTPVSAAPTPWSARPAAERSFTGSAEDRSYMAGPPRPGTAQSRRGGSDNYQMDSLPRPNTAMSSRSRVRQSSDPEQNFIPSSAMSERAPTLPNLQPQRTRTPANNHNPYFPPVPESPAALNAPPIRAYTPASQSPYDAASGHTQPAPRLRTPSNDQYAPMAYAPFNPAQPGYHPPRYASNNVAPPRSQTASVPPIQHNNLPPLRQPQRGNTFDDILDHY